LAPGSITSVGWSKLCHNSTSEEGFSTMARFPVFKRTALAVFMLVLVILAMLVDQITDSVYYDKVAIAGDFQLCLVDAGADDWCLPIDDPYGGEDWDLVEPYAKVPVGGGCGVGGLTKGV
jgi:hypothetical protein